MSDTSRHIGPGSFALRRLKFGDVIERKDIALHLVAVLLGRKAHQEDECSVGPRDIRLALDRLLFGLTDIV